MNNQGKISLSNKLAVLFLLLLLFYLCVRVCVLSFKQSSTIGPLGVSITFSIILVAEGTYLTIRYSKCRTFMALATGKHPAVPLKMNLGY